MHPLAGRTGDGGTHGEAADMAESLTPAAFALLLALTDGERHGYALMADVDRLSAGGLVLGPGTLYRTLQRLRVAGLIEEADVDPAAVRADGRAGRRRRYRITAAGHAAARDEATRLAALLDSPSARRLRAEGLSATRPPEDVFRGDRWARDAAAD
ncbi:PadR family transcriptional regulator [Mangrovihabitans endophyticus]|uniref:Transcription regulator PadR N-terminal domain-containing protein n=1 Tax=Mangrovihabitans endophyticus TaxID=1751298 RepID=A0A8J3FMX5_9ACTN|nr:helix-turn-helix transcriptional regulator [Mangrovihabitans endophyticus]GGK76696.1 hypothetical protein GCM10012284_08350 [Mangrovihabitans endophyticus]